MKQIGGSFVLFVFLLSLAVVSPLAAQVDPGGSCDPNVRWCSPPAPPTDGNPAAPVNTSSRDQVKKGGLEIGPDGNLIVTGAGLFENGFGLTASDGSSVTFSNLPSTVGNFTIGPTNLIIKNNNNLIPATGKVLTATDDTGLASWADLSTIPGSSPWTTLGDDIYNNNTGNVGIGTTNPNNTIQVADLINFDNSQFSTFLGYQAGNVNTGLFNTAVGHYALRSNTTGYSNTANGRSTLYSNTTGYANTANGYEALFFNNGENNTANGASALRSNAAGDNNTANGASALRFNTAGDNNTANGANALRFNTTGSYNTALGNFANVSLGDLSNATAIGAGAIVDASNKVRIGNTSVSSIGGEVGWSSFSDARGKYNVKDYTRGLDLVLNLRPVEFKLKDDATKKTHSGFIAQEVEAIGVPFYGLNKPETDQGSYSLTYAEFVVPLVRSVQEQQKQIENLNAKIEEQQKEITQLKLKK